MKKWLTGLMLMGYLLGVSRGYVAVWHHEDPEPILVTDTKVSLLPYADQQALEKGIEIPDARALTKALEDYCS